jgi:hypothetical protein
MMTHRLYCLVAFVVVGLALGGCGTVAPEKRHTPAEIAAYQAADFAAEIASDAGEAAARADALAVIYRAAALPAGFDPDRIIPGALWNIGFLNAEFPIGQRLVLEALPGLPTRDADYQRGVLSAAYTFYSREAAPVLATMLDRFTTPREFAIAAYTVAKDAPFMRERIIGVMRMQFSAWADEPRLVRLERAMRETPAEAIAARPPLEDLLAHRFTPGTPVVYSFQRQDRRRFGLAVVRAPDGRFVRNADGSVFHVAHLANAITNLPGTITNGHTPQGLFTIVGAGTATNKWIGPTPYLHSKVPVEAPLAEFLHNDSPPLVGEENIKSWTDEAYQAFLPEKWRGYWGFMEALHAGRAGRDEMLAHGTTIRSSYYAGASYYPGTPSAGCLVAMENWSPVDGRLTSSDQLSLVKAFTRDGVDRGHLVVVELDDQLRPVALEDILPAIMRAEAQSASSASAGLLTAPPKAQTSARH